MSAATGRASHPALPQAAWPDADRAAWAAGCRQGDFLEPGGRGAAWRPASRRSAERAYGRWLAWLIDRQVDLAAEAPAERFTDARVRSYLAFVAKGRSPVTVVSYLGCLIMVVTALFPERDWRRLRATHGRLNRQAKPIHRKQGQLVSAGDLLQLGLDLMAHATEVLDDSSGKIAATGMRKAARDFRDGLLIALLASRPLRVKNLLGIEIGTQLRRGAGQSTLRFTEDETKQVDVFAVPWPSDLEAPLTRYIDDIRPRLIAADPPGGLTKLNHAPRPVGASLWVAQGGTPLTPCGLRKAIRRHTRRRFGHVLTAHWFRDCMATTVAEKAPDQMPVAARILGHGSLNTTERHYVAATSESALSRYHDLIVSIRQQIASDPERRE